MSLSRIHNGRREWTPLAKLRLKREGGSISPSFGQELLVELESCGFDKYGQAAFMKDDSGVWLKYHGPSNGVILYCRNTQKTRTYKEMGDLINLWGDIRTLWRESKG